MAIMSDEEYEAAWQAAHNGESYDGPPENWNKDYRAKLDKHGLMLCYAEPKRRVYIMAPVPTYVEGLTTPHTPDTDPHAWFMPAWIVPKT